MEEAKQIIGISRNIGLVYDYMDRERTHGVKETFLLVSLEPVTSSIGRPFLDSVPVE